MKLPPYILFGRSYSVRIEKNQYVNGGVALNMVEDGGSEDGLPFAKCTASISDELHGTEVAIKNYSENEGMLQFLVKNNVVEPPHSFVQSGYVSFPICKLLM